MTHIFLNAANNCCTVPQSQKLEEYPHFVAVSPYTKKSAAKRFSNKTVENEEVERKLQKLFDNAKYLSRKKKRSLFP